MKCLNKVMLIGRLGADPEVRYTPTGIAYTRLSVATSEPYVDKDGNRQEMTEWHKVIAWRKLAEICGQYLTKGRLVYIEGRLRTRTWEQDGVKRSATEIEARDMQILDAAKARPEPEEDNAPPLDDLPF
jgi:single-strand DNA-binding protein